MQILVVGGTGMVGGHAALHLSSLGHNFLKGDYVERSFTREDLTEFEAIVFAAGHDVRHSPQGTEFDQHVLHVNGEAVPRFARLARDAGVRRFIHIGSYYPHVAPELVNTSAYVRSRKLATGGIFALAEEDFLVSSLDAPFIVGAVPGMRSPMFEAYIQYALGKIDIPPFGPSGGSNFISTQSLSEAIAGAMERGESPKAYLLGDEDLTFASYFELFFRVVGNPAEIPSLDTEHPLLPDSAIYTSRGKVVSYEPDSGDVARLGYRRHDVERAVKEVVALLQPAVEKDN
ncbi:hypothetical protein BBP40_008721 [Aspergillus hancockii]|nr:hypothetical protein BBP40_008721 [Aspergillus hancockii]